MNAVPSLLLALLAAGAPAADPPPTTAAESPTSEQRIEELDQKVKILERRNELAAEQAAEKAKTAASVSTGKDGFALKSADGAFQLKLRGYVHADARAYLDDEQRPGTDTFILRRARPIFEGTLYSRVDFRIMPDFGGGTTVLQDAYIDLKLSPALRIRGGKFKTPFGLERLQSATDLLFVERALPTSLAPNRDLGIQLFGDLADERVSYAVGLFNGVVDGGSADADAEDAKDFAARLFVQPFAANKASALKGLGFGLAASRGDREGTPASPGLPAYRTPGQLAFFGYRTDGTPAGSAVADGRLSRLSPQLYFYRGPFGLHAEGVRSSHEVVRGAVRRELTHESFQVSASWLVSGEAATYKSVTPKKGFDPPNHGWGAFEVAARYHGLDLDDDTFPVFANPASAARRVRSWGLALNWYLVKGVRVMLDYDQSRFDGGATAGDRPDEKVLFSRLQVAF